MRFSGWILGLVGFVGLIGLTATCALVSFNFTRQAVIDAQAENGILLEDPVSMARCITQGDCSDSVTPETLAVNNVGPVQMTPLVTIAPTIVPTESVSVADNVTPETPNPDATTALESPTPVPTIDPLAHLQITDPRQIRILLLGIDQRSAVDQENAYRSDTMILINVDPVRKTVGVISLPRDLWVNIPSFEPARINTANYLGDLNAYPGGGGPALAMETVAENFGIRVDKYLLVNFDVFTSVVETIAPNGVEVNITEIIDDPKYPDAGYGTIYVRFDPGVQRLNAEELLQYARTRATQGGDFDRARRQQQVLDAVRAEVLSAGGIVNFISQAPNLWSQLSSSFRTNLEYDEILQLGALISEIERDDIHYAVIDNQYVDLGMSPDGSQEVLFPNRAAISDLIQRVFFPQNELSLADLQSRANAENARIYVYNGTSVAGLAGATREWFVGRGISITDVGNDTEHNGRATIIKDYGGNHPWTSRYLAAVLGIPQERIQPGADGLVAEGVMVVVGSDIQPILDGQ